MSLFDFGKKQDETKACSCSCGCSSGSTNEEVVTSCCLQIEDGVKNIKVLGSGCKSCHELYENAQKAIKDMGLNIEVEYITDIKRLCPMES